ncbi:MAG: FkbM family methyltransferase [Magnetospirillum sp.]
MEDAKAGKGAADNIQPPVTAIRRCRHGHMMYLRGDRYVGRSLELYGEYSEAEVDLFRQIVHPGHVVVEAGANIGSLTIPLARRVGDKGRVFAFEPQRAVYNVLCANLALNGLMNVDALRSAVGGQTGQVSIPVLDYTGTGNYGGVTLGASRKGPAESVPVVNIDALNLPKLDFLKIDVEGHELAVLQGAAATIDRLRPALFVENDRRTLSRQLIEMIQAHNYRLWWHLSPLYRADNFHGNPDNVFGNVLSINMLGLPMERKTAVTHLRPVEGVEDWWR